jgi:hypothetical protein
MRAIAILLVLTSLAACGPAGEEESVSTEAPDLQISGDVEERRVRFAPTELTADLSALPESERQALEHLLAAARLMDEIFLRQAWEGNPEMREALAAAGSEAARDYFAINFGPWDRLDDHRAPFIGAMEHPAGAGYYPTDLTAEELEAWIAEQPEDEAAMTSLTTVVRRDGEGLVAVPYSEAYREWLEPAAEHLRQAAAATQNESLRDYLEKRAAAFASDDYYESDLAWMDLESPVEVTIGPYETYEDGLFGYKAAFEAFVTVALEEESKALADYKNQLPWLERNLPIPDEHKNFDRGTESPIRVVDVVFTGGDTKAGVQTIAFNLPNDERVREAKGSKKVMLRNVTRAKYDQILVPIAKRVMVPGSVDRVSFDAYWNEVLHHELSHGLGPGQIVVDGRETEVRLELKELYSTLEEAKADVMGVYNILSLIEAGKMPAELRDTLETTYVAGLFRSARFGLHEAHGRGVVSQFNYLLEKGALTIDEEGRFAAVSELFPAAIEQLLTEMLMLQATGDYDGTATFLDTYGVASDELVAAIDRLEGIPVDIRPLYPQAG